MTPFSRWPRQVAAPDRVNVTLVTEAQLKGHRVFPLHLLIWIVFAFLLLFVGVLVTSAGFFITRDILQSAASDSARRIGREIMLDVEGYVTPAEMAVRLISHSSLADATTLDTRMTRLALLRDALETSPVLQSLYVGYATGDFFYVRHLSNDADRSMFAAPKNADYMVQSITRDRQGPQGRNIYLDRALVPIETADDPTFARQYDPRRRPWYIEAVSAGDLIRTAPYVFFTDKGAGATLAIPASNKGAVVGGDIRLDMLGQMLSHMRRTSHTVIALLDVNGHLLASGSDIGGASAAQVTEGHALLRPASEYGVPVLTHLASRAAALGDATQMDEIARIGGRDWYTWVERLVTGGGKPYFLVLAIPQDELLTGAKRQAQAALGLTILVLLIAIPVTWLFARAISRPLQVLAGQAAAIRRLEFGETFVIRSRVSEVNGLSRAMDEMRLAIRRFLDIMREVASEPDLDRLLPQLMKEIMQVAGSTAGALYLVQNEVMGPVYGWSGGAGEITSALSSMPLSAAPPIVHRATAEGAVCASALADAADLRDQIGQLVSGNATHVAIVPLINRQRDLVGMMLLPRGRPFETPELAFIGALAGLLANSIEVRGLLKTQRELFDDFIRMIAGAIDSKSPHTGAHCARVPEVVKLIAKAGCEARNGPFADFAMSAADWEVLHVAAWLHDCGKVTTPEYVIDKATKLETLHDRIHEIRMRFEVLKRDAGIRCLQERLAGADEATATAKRDVELRQLDDDFAFVAACNLGAEYMEETRIERLKSIASRTWLRTLDDRIGISQEELSRKLRTAPASLPAVEPLLADRPEHCIERCASDRIPPDNPWGFHRDTPELLYNRGEMYNLCVGRGTLSAEERYKIEDHIVQTQIMLSRLNFPKYLRRVPEIAGNHHETMDGTGYPRRLRKQEMSTLARMMAVADVFEALTSKDRPYRKSKTLSEAVQIMASMKKRGQIDPDIFELFLSSGAYRTYAERFMSAEQLDELDIRRYVGSWQERADSAGR
ncbi:Phosphohydrolase [Paraburkholderia unamae]|uniref:HD domain-containing phosphohydrolase n=1 Tax=Paraburkholderia unamae TaxID=219649 RepID=UPI001CB5D53F|nr:HD domain-containing phosphohydrolase [Paraburkholderia unamae]CAG9252128.1 Phosphohydrolase [Paraburkholderia unamae]